MRVQFVRWCLPCRMLSLTGMWGLLVCWVVTVLCCDSALAAHARIVMLDVRGCNRWRRMIVFVCVRNGGQSDADDVPKSVTHGWCMLLLFNCAWFVPVVLSVVIFPIGRRVPDEYGESGRFQHGKDDCKGGPMGGCPFLLGFSLLVLYMVTLMLPVVCPCSASVCVLPMSRCLASPSVLQRWSV